ncbi:tdpoz3 [Trichonephila clavata]|uniref:Tdpoz3 n=1 Tax=Trichonephila clavata TaxID=2740835 RepID=A0A8X6L5B1_TRICU|nr:tdpoz3 [Trichonephila clavata]
MACNSNVESNLWITFFWNIEISEFYPQKDKVIIGSLFDLDRTTEISGSAFKFTPAEENNVDIFFYIYAYWDKLTNIEVEWDLAFLADDDLVLQVKPKASSTFQKIGPRAEIKHKICDEVIKDEMKVLMSQDTLRTRCRIWRTDGNTVVPVTFFVKTPQRTSKFNCECNIERFSSLETGHYFNFINIWDYADKILKQSIGVKMRRIKLL